MKHLYILIIDQYHDHVLAKKSYSIKNDWALSNMILPSGIDA